jgi:hypothetical protein
LTSFLGSFPREIALPALFSTIYSPFLPFFAKRTQLVFFSNIFISKYFRIFQLGSFGKNTLLYRKLSRWGRRSRVGRDAVVANADPRSGEPKAEPRGSERVQSRARHHSAGLCTHVSLIHAHTPMLSPSQKYR